MPLVGLRPLHSKVSSFSKLCLCLADLNLVHAKKMVQARKIIAEGCEKCPKSEDIWFHAAELNVRTVSPAHIPLTSIDAGERKGYIRSSGTTCASIGKDMDEGCIDRDGCYSEEEGITER